MGENDNQGILEWSPYFELGLSMQRVAHAQGLGFSTQEQAIVCARQREQVSYPNLPSEGTPSAPFMEDIRPVEYPHLPTIEVNNRGDESTSTAQSQRFVVNITPELAALKRECHNVILMFGTSGEPALYKSIIPFPQQWKSPDYVRLPHDSQHSTTVTQPLQRRPMHVRKWDVIKEELAKLQGLICSNQLDMSQSGNQIRLTVLKYNSKVMDFTFNLLNQRKVSKFLQIVFPVIVKSALEMEHRFPNGVPVLRKGRAQTIFFTQGQIRCILANAFLCTFPKRLELEGLELPDINFMRLFDGGARGDSKPNIEKILCILNYFSRVQELEGEGNLISYERRYLNRSLHPDWQTSRDEMSRIHMKVNGKIEEAIDMLQVDFANRFAGGGIIGNGSLMEEIRFAICPELIAVRLFTEAFGHDEVLIVTGCEQFSKYSGYGDTFTFAGDHQDTQVIDCYGRKRTQVAVMDAYNFGMDNQKQYHKDFLVRELHKCYCAFRPRRTQQHIRPIATGNWGCGAFNGDPELKFILQWMAASQAGQRELHYFTTGNKAQADKIMHMVKHLGRKGVCVGSLFQALLAYHAKEVESLSFYKARKPLFQFLEKHFK